MKSKAFRLLLTIAVLAVAVWTPSYASDPPPCPTDWCSDLLDQCIDEGNNHDYMGWIRSTSYTCKDENGDIQPLSYLECCTLPNCNPLVWLRYCKDF